MENLENIVDEEDYQLCVQNAKAIRSLEKILFCQNFYYVFYAEIELQLNRFFTLKSREQWSLLFVDYSFMPPVPLNNQSIHKFRYEPHILTILLNAKVKYRCLDCRYEWTSARGRAIFQAETLEQNKHNVLFGYLFPQKCQLCREDTEPSWYLDEVTRVMKHVCRILIEEFYSDREFFSPSSSRSSSFDEDDPQRESHMNDYHYRELCRACHEGSCYISHW